jgi:hypothetical protein
MRKSYMFAACSAVVLASIFSSSAQALTLSIPSIPSIVVGGLKIAVPVAPVIVVPVKPVIAPPPTAPSIASFFAGKK